MGKRKVKILEEGGSTIKEILAKTDPWERDRKCKRNDCPACKYPRGGELLQKKCVLQRYLYQV